MTLEMTLGKTFLDLSKSSSRKLSRRFFFAERKDRIGLTGRIVLVRIAVTVVFEAVLSAVEYAGKADI